MFSFFKKASVLQDEPAEEQLKDIEPPELRQLAAVGDDCDEIPSAIGMFGHEISNPIPVNGIRGAIKYLNRLRCSCSKNLFAHRLGHIDTPNVKGLVDVYETVCSQMKHWDILYIHFYHPRRSRKTPDGYSMIPFHPEFSRTIIGMTTNTTCLNFPIGMEPIIMSMLGLKFGKMVIDAHGARLSEPSSCIRPAAQVGRIAEVIQTGYFVGQVPGDLFGQPGMLFRISKSES